MSGPLQVEFFFSGPPLSADCGSASRTDYAGFNLNGVEYKVGDCAFLYPEDEGVPPYVGRILACFHDRSGCAADPHCVEVAWFERRAHLEVDPLGSNWEREVVALEETDINPIGCISGKAVVFKAGCYEEAFQMAKSLDGMEWFFCRGVYKQNENCVTPYPELVNGIYPNDGKRNAKRLLTGAVGAAEVVADSEDVKRFRVSDEQPAAPVRRTGKLVSGRTCVECGATQTPQWREGPAGPKTLCNACGVRYVRAQQRANKRAVSAGGSRGGCGPGGRNARSNKAARAEAATARAARAAAAAEEVPQRPLRQAALLAANRTAQYARTGIFPQDQMDLKSFDNRSGSHVLQHPHQQSRWQHQNMEAARSAPAAPSAGRRNTDANATTAATAHVSALRPPQTQPATPNSSSFDSSGTGNEGVTVEVLVDVAEGEADCCTAGGVHRGVVTSGGGGFSCAAYPPLLPPQLPLPLLPTYESNCSAVGGGVLVCNMPTSEQTAARVGTAGSSQGGVVMPPNNLAPPQQPASPSGAVHGGLCHMPPGQHSWSRGVACGYHGYGGIMFGVASGRGMAAEEGDESGQQHPDSQTELCSHGYESGGGGGCIEVQYGGSGGGGSTYASSGGDSPGVQVISAPVSPSGPGDETAMYDSTFGGCGSCGSGGGLGDEDQLQLHRVYSGQLGCGLGCELDMDEEYDRLVEGDFGLGPEGDMDGGDLFELHDPCAAMTSCTGDCHSALQDAAEGPNLTPEDLPAVAARAAAFCPDLAPGTEARTLLDAIPSFTSAAAAAAAASMNMGVPLVRTAPTIAVSFPAPAAAAVSVHVARGGAGSLGSCTAVVSPVVGSGEVGPGEVLVPDEAVTQLLSVGRQVDRATTEAMAADAALQAVSQVLEARHEAARRAREAAAANLVRLKDCITHLAGADAASKAVSELAAGPLIDLRDLVGSGLPGVGALDGAELVVAVRS